MASGGVYRSDPFRPVLPSVGHYGVKLESEGSESDTDSEPGDPSSSDEGLDTLTPYPPLHQPKGGVRSEEDYVPSPNQSGGSRDEEETSGSSTPSSDSGESLQREVSRPKMPRRLDLSDDEEDLRPPQRLATGGRGYEVCPPRRKAAKTVNYQEFYQSEDDESSAGEGVRQRRRRARGRRDSDSEFEVTVHSEESSEEGLETSEDEYMEGNGQRRRRGRRKGWAGSDSDSDYMPGAGARSRQGRKRKATGRLNEWYEHSLPVVSSSSESEFEPGGGAARRRRRRGQAATDFVRMTSRRKGVVSYKESSSEELEEGLGGGEGEGPPVEDNRETIEKVLKKRIGRVGDTGKAVYSQEVVGSPKEDEATEVQYLIKWVNWSHLHNTWETEASLLSQGVKGMKKFYNWLKREEERELWERGATPEDIEYFKCQEELVEQLLEQYTVVERVIAARNSDEGLQEYLCKWRGLPYSDCTWEDGQLISDKFQDQIDMFLDRNNSDRIPMRNAKVLRQRPKFAIMKDQLPGLGGVASLPLRNYQLDGVNWLVHSWCKFNSVILADEMGLGKTIQTIAFLHCLYHTHCLYGPHLLVVPLSTMSAWQREFELWAPEINAVVYLGDVSSREMIREHEWAHPNRRLKFNVILTTYEILLKDKESLGSLSWAVLVVDEAHRLKNDDSLLYRTLMGFRTNHRLLVTGTPLQNSLKELWSLLHFIMEKEFPSWEEFEGVYGKGDAGSLSSLHQAIQLFLLRRVKKDVEKSLPAKVEQILRVEMSSIQKQYYKWILSKNYKALSKGVKGSITGFINLAMELKKCCNHAWIVRAPEGQERDRLTALLRGSGKMFLLDKLLLRLRETNHRVLIFSQMVRMLDILAEYMQLRHFPFQRLDGSIRGDQRKDAIDHFNAEGSQDFCFLLSTRAGGLGVNLATADTVVIFDSDWNPQNDLQAQARAHRIGQTKQVNIYRLVMHSSIEEEIVERAKKKMVLDHLIIQKMDTTGRTVLSQTAEPSRSVPFDKEELNAILKFGAEELFREGDKEGDQALQEMDIDDILRRAEMQSAQEDHSVANELLSQFKVANFALDEEEMAELTTPTEGTTLHLPSSSASNDGTVEKSWDEVIPLAIRQRVEEEEKTKEQLQLYLPPRQRTVQNYCEENQDRGSRHPTKGGRGRRKGGVAPQQQQGPEKVEDADVVKVVRGFTDHEIRRFVKSYRKFCNPRCRLDALAADAELQEKSVSELERLLDTLHDGCVEAEARHGGMGETGRHKGAILRLHSVTIFANSILKREKELEALAVCIPAEPEARKRFRMVTRTKSVGWAGVRWTAVDDARLLVGVYEYGVGSWESIRSDPALGLSKKILPANKAMKPQASHLQTRVEYLLRLIMEEAKLKQTGRKNPKVSRPVRGAQRGAGSRSEVITDYFKQEGSTKDSLTVNIPRDLLVGPMESESRRKRSGNPSSQRQRSQPGHAAKRGRVTSHRKNRVKQEDRTSVPDTGDMEPDDSTFKKCKSLLRPVKKALSQLSPSDELSTDAAIQQYKKVLLEIGDHISSCMSRFTAKEAEEWRQHLWVFVSKFTSVPAQRLHKLYRKVRREAARASSHNQSQDPPIQRNHPKTNYRGNKSGRGSTMDWSPVST